MCIQKNFYHKLSLSFKDYWWQNKHLQRKKDYLCLVLCLTMHKLMKDKE